MIELQDIFYQHGEDYRKAHTLPLNVLKAMTAIEIPTTVRKVLSLCLSAFLKINFNILITA